VLWCTWDLAHGSRARARSLSLSQCDFHRSKPSEVYALLKSLYEGGVDINVKNHAGLTCLHMSVQQQNLDSIAFLLKHKADPNITNKGKVGSYLQKVHSRCAPLSPRSGDTDDIFFVSGRRELLCSLEETE
jgi:ankyrin repeat protein